MFKELGFIKRSADEKLKVLDNPAEKKKAVDKPGEKKLGDPKNSVVPPKLAPPAKTLSYDA